MCSTTQHQHFPSTHSKPTNNVASPIVSFIDCLVYNLYIVHSILSRNGININSDLNVGHADRLQILTLLMANICWRWYTSPMLYLNNTTSHKPDNKIKENDFFYSNQHQISSCVRWSSWKVFAFKASFVQSHYMRCPALCVRCASKFSGSDIVYV